MPLQFVASQIANNQISADKMLLSGGQTFDFSASQVLVATPSSGTEAANKAYVDNASAGLYWKEPVEVATVANITLSGAQTIDGVAIIAEDRVLVRAQSDAEDNGIYICKAGSWARSEDMNESDEFAGSAVFVLRGTTYNDAAFVCTNDSPPNVGTDAINFVQFSGLGQVTAGDGLTKTGNTLAVDLATNSGLEFNSGKLQVENAGLVLEKQGWLVAYEEFTTTGALTFTLTTADTTTIPAAFQTSKNIRVFRNGQLQRAETGTGQPSDNNGYKVQTSGDDLQFTIKNGNALAANEILQVSYIYNAS